MDKVGYEIDIREGEKFSQKLISRYPTGTFIELLTFLMRIDASFGTACKSKNPANRVIAGF